jgi:hypothetical protein
LDVSNDTLRKESKRLKEKANVDTTVVYLVTAKAKCSQLWLEAPQHDGIITSA